MLGRTSWSAVKRPLRVIAGAVAASVLILTTAAPANADFEGTQVTYTPCTPAWTADHTNAYARIGEHYKAITHYGNAVLIEFAHSTLDSFSCSASESRKNAEALWIVNQFDLYGTGMQCSTTIQIPPGFSYTCTRTSSHITLSFTRKCIQTSACEAFIGNTWVYAEPGQRFFNYMYMHTHARLDGPSGRTYPFDTHRF